ncbi:hypothetical protein C8R46DRAFT_1286143 [Mycena filopes]|nr:hypothetical protein C8R46DRAFT_1286143 [Mycena filopes]
MATLDNTIGLIFQATVISAALYGAGCLQAWFYFRTYLKRDSCWVKFLVTFVVVCDTCQQAILTASTYSYLITNFANPAILNHVARQDAFFSTFVIQIYFSDFIALAVQLFYCYRVYRVSNGSWLASGCLAVFSVGTFAILFVYSTKALKMSTYTELITLKTLSMSGNIAATVTDALISAFLIFYLYISKTGYEGTDDLINRLIAFTFNTGLPPTICALLGCISINAWPDTYIYIFWGLLQSRCYTNTLLVSLNTRDYIRAISGPGSIQEIHLTTQSPRHLSHRESTIAIRIDTTSSVQRDLDHKNRAQSQNSSPSVEHT